MQLTNWRIFKDAAPWSGKYVIGPFILVGDLWMSVIKYSESVVLEHESNYYYLHK